MSTSRLSRRLDLGDAVFIGLGAMIGAGIFSSLAPAARAAGSGALLGLVLAAIVAGINASSMAQLASLYPESGGTYVYAGKRFGEYPGFMAGWAFVIGKIASCCAMALTFAQYLVPERWVHATAFAVVVVMTIVNYYGIKKTAAATKLLVSIVIATLVVFVVSTLGAGQFDADRLVGWFDQAGISGVLQSAGIWFFAFAGYARLATLGEEVVDPKTTIPKAIALALAISLGIYLLVVIAALSSISVDLLAFSPAPLSEVANHLGHRRIALLVGWGAAAASAGVLLSLLAGVSRTIFAMAANGDLPRELQAVHAIHRVPHRAEVVVGVIIASLVFFVDLRTSIGFSSFAILIYYAIANLCVLDLRANERLYPVWLARVGMVLCLVIAFNLPWKSIGGGSILFGIGSVYWFLRSRFESGAR